VKKGVIGAILIVAVVVAVLVTTGLLGIGLFPKGTSFTANFTTSPVAGSNDTIQFNSTVSGGSAPYRYVWAFGDGNFSALQNPRHVYVPGTYTVELIVIDTASASASISKSVTVTA
jgi:PKD repeat protein